MAKLYELTQNQTGAYTEADFARIIEGADLLDYHAFKERFIAGVEDLEPLFLQVSEYLGLNLISKPYPSLSESLLGIQVEGSEAGTLRIKNFLPQVASLWGLMRGDQLLTLGNTKIGENWKEILAGNMGRKQVPLTFFRWNQLRQTHIDIPASLEFTLPQFAFSLSPTEEQMHARRAWGALPTQGLEES